VAGLAGDLLWRMLARRRAITLANLRACFPDRAAAWHEDVGRRSFRCLARSIIDHGLLNEAPREAVRAFVRVEGEAHLLDPANRPLICVAPHFVGIDPGGVRFAELVRGVSLYSRAKNAAWDAWLLKARRRFNEPVLLRKSGADMRPVIRALREGLPFYYAPDVDVGPPHSIFVPFFGVPAATVPMAARLARMVGARVMMAVTEMTDDGWVLHLEPPLPDFPGATVEDDTRRVNEAIERWVLRMPEQYLWSHRRFKTRPDGMASLY
jgi:KDO2-lipid IV(A) lauroyltransferase